MTYNVFGGTLNLAQSISPTSTSNLTRSFFTNIKPSSMGGLTTFD